MWPGWQSASEHFQYVLGEVKRSKETGQVERRGIDGADFGRGQEVTGFWARWIQTRALRQGARLRRKRMVI